MRFVSCGLKIFRAQGFKFGVWFRVFRVQRFRVLSCYSGSGLRNQVRCIYMRISGSKSDWVKIAHVGVIILRIS